MKSAEAFYEWLEQYEPVDPNSKRGRKPSKKQYFTVVTENAIIAYINPLILVNQKTEMGYRF